MNNKFHEKLINSGDIDQRAARFKNKYDSINFNQIAEDLEFENDIISSPLLVNEKCVNFKGKNLDDREIRILRLLTKAHE